MKNNIKLKGEIPSNLIDTPNGQIVKGRKKGKKGFHLPSGIFVTSIDEAEKIKADMCRNIHKVRIYTAQGHIIRLSDIG